jgi:hypothetical protein
MKAITDKMLDYARLEEKLVQDQAAGGGGPQLVGP